MFKLDLVIWIISCAAVQNINDATSKKEIQHFQNKNKTLNEVVNVQVGQMTDFCQLIIKSFSTLNFLFCVETCTCSTVRCHLMCYPLHDTILGTNWLNFIYRVWSLFFFSYSSMSCNRLWSNWTRSSWATQINEAKVLVIWCKLLCIVRCQFRNDVWSGENFCSAKWTSQLKTRIIVHLYQFLKNHQQSSTCLPNSFRGANERGDTAHNIIDNNDKQSK